jgi:hypothetical protein
MSVNRSINNIVYMPLQGIVDRLDNLAENIDQENLINAGIQDAIYELADDINSLPYIASVGPL